MYKTIGVRYVKSYPEKVLTISMQTFMLYLTTQQNKRVLGKK